MIESCFWLFFTVYYRSNRTFSPVIPITLIWNEFTLFKDKLNLATTMMAFVSTWTSQCMSTIPTSCTYILHHHCLNSGLLYSVLTGSFKSALSFNLHMGLQGHFSQAGPESAVRQCSNVCMEVKVGSTCVCVCLVWIQVTFNELRGSHYGFPRHTMTFQPRRGKGEVCVCVVQVWARWRRQRMCLNAFIIN